jgi:hypothetical protein
VRRELLAPERVQKMAREMQAHYLERVRVMQEQAWVTSRPRKFASVQNGDSSGVIILTASGTRADAELALLT